MWVKLHVCNKLLFLEISFTTGFNVTDRLSVWWGGEGYCAPSKEVEFGLVCSLCDKPGAAFMEMRTLSEEEYLLYK
jgi:hypothetical protein